MKAEDKSRTVRERDYTIRDDDERRQALRFARRYAGPEITGEVVIRLNKGAPLAVSVREVEQAK